MSKSLIKEGTEKTFFIILEGVTSKNTEIIELVREMITKKTVTIGSHADPKYIDHCPLKNFLIAITTSTVDDFSPRFSSLLFPIQFPTLTEFSHTFLTRKIMNTYAVNSDFVDYFITASKKLFTIDQTWATLIHVIHCPSKRFETDDDKQTMISLLCSSVYTNTPGNILERSQKVDSALQSIFQDSPIIQKFLNYQKEENFMTTTTFIFTPPNCNYIASTEKLPVSQLISKLIVQTKSNVTLETVLNFAALDKILNTPNQHCSLTSVVGRGRSYLVRQVCQFRGFKLHNFSINTYTLKDLQSAFYGAFYDNKVQVILTRYSDNNHDKYNFIKAIFIDLNFLPLFTEKELESLIQKVAHVETVTNEIKFAAIETIKVLIKTLVRVVILNDTTDPLPEFAHLDLVFPSKEEICKSFIDENKVEHLTPIFIAVSELFEKQLIYPSISMFNDFVDGYVSSATGVMSKALVKNENMALTLKFIETVKQNLQSINDEITDLEPKLQELKDKNEELKTAYNSKHDVIEMRRLKLNEESMYKTRALRDSKKEVEDLENGLKKLVPSIEKIYDEIAEVNEADLKPISINADSPPDAVRLAFTVLPTLLGMPGNYETSGVKLMHGDTFAHMVHDGIDYKKIQDEHIDLIRLTLNDPAFKRSEVESIAPVMVLIRDLFEGIDNYRHQADAVLERKLQYQVEEKELENFHEDMKRELESMQEIEDRFVDDAKELKALGGDLSRMETKYKLYLQRRENAEKLIENTDGLIEEWQKEQERIGKGNNDDNMTGDVILIAAYIAYCGSLEYEQRNNSNS